MWRGFRENRIIHIIIILVILAFIVAGIHGRNPDSPDSHKPVEAKTMKPEVKAYCMSHVEDLNCILLIKNNLNKLIYIKRAAILYANTSIDLDLNMNGITIEPRNYSTIILDINKTNTKITQISYNGNRTITIALDAGPLLDALKDPEETPTPMLNVTRSLVIDAGEGAIIPVDYELNLSGSNWNLLAWIEANTSSGLLIDTKIFLWNDILYYEKVVNVWGGEATISLPIPGTNAPDSIVSMITINIINKYSHPVNVTASIAIMETPGVNIYIEYIGGGVEVSAPMEAAIPPNPKA
ncbi:MAG: hypothetical protein F7C38_06720 [Desulfurococcales archaeon]|nr:hypothetical protein [Desulfurococcales archaeon]